MKKFVVQLGVLLGPLRADERIGPVHVCVYLALFQLADGRDGWFRIDSKEVMKLGKIKGWTTYYRVMRELAGMGLVEYEGTRDWRRGSWVRVFHL